MGVRDTPEEWRGVLGYEDRYEISSIGRVRTLDRWYKHNLWGTLTLRKGRVMSPSVSKDGHLRVGLTNGKSRARLKFVHRLVAQAFIPNPDNLPIVRHLNDVPDDNRVENLAWGTVSDNWNDMVRNGNHWNARKTHCPQGHEYTDDNTRVDAQGRRSCRACHRARQAEYRKKRRKVDRQPPIL